MNGFTTQCGICGAKCLSRADFWDHYDATHTQRPPTPIRLCADCGTDGELFGGQAAQWRDERGRRPVCRHLSKETA